MTLTIPTADELYAAAQAETQARQANLTDWAEGSALDAITGGGVLLADQSIRIALYQASQSMIATAVDDGLDAAVTDKYPDLTRREETASIGILHIIRGGSTGILTVPAGTQVTATIAGRTVTVETDADASMAAVASYVDVNATCTETGTVGNLAPNSLFTFASPLSGDATATVNNLDRFVGGFPAETDDAYRARAQAYPLTLRRATVSALEQGALTVPGVAYVTIDESEVETTGIVNVYVGDPDGRGNLALSTLVETELDNWRAAGVRLAVYPSTREEVTVTVTVYVQAGRGSDALKAACAAAIIAYGDSLAPNMDMYLSAIEAAAIGVSPATLGGYILGAVAASVDATGETIDPTAAYNALRVTSTTLTVTFSEVS